MFGKVGAGVGVPVGVGVGAAGVGVGVGPAGVGVGPAGVGVGAVGVGVGPVGVGVGVRTCRRGAVVDCPGAAAVGCEKSVLAVSRPTTNANRAAPATSLLVATRPRRDGRQKRRCIVSSLSYRVFQNV